MFVALVPPDDAIEDLEEFLAPRQEAGAELRWTAPEQWHVTLAFFGDVHDRHLDDLVERLGRAATRRTPVDLAIAGGGAFPNPARAKIVWAGGDAGIFNPFAKHRGEVTSPRRRYGGWPPARGRRVPSRGPARTAAASTRT